MKERYQSISEVNTDDVSPMMKHYIETKRANPDSILFYRLGDFYEMFFDDAILVSRELELTLTGKACGLETRAAMCGVPFHAADNYISRLTSKGYKVAICEQMEDPKLAKGIVKRDIIRIVTPGTNLNTGGLESDKHNYLMCIAYQPDVIGIATADITTGDFLLTEVEDLSVAMDEIMRFMPAEIVAGDSFLYSGIDMTAIRERLGCAVFPIEAKLFDEDHAAKSLIRHFKVTGLKALGVEEFPTGICAAGALISYMERMQKSEMTGFTSIYPYRPGRFMLLDTTARRNLELTETLRDKTKRGTLLWVLDKTCTAMGARRLREWILQPLIEYDDIMKRQNAVETCVKDLPAREELREYLRPVYDLERLMAKISYHTATPKDLLSFCSSLKLIAPIKNTLFTLTKDPYLMELSDEMDALEDLAVLIEKSISPEAPLSAKEGGVILSGYDETIDALRDAETNGRQWLIDLEEATKNTSGIKNLKIKYASNFGYVFEVSKVYTGAVPDDFIRRQTLTNCERYTTPKLKELEDTILHSRDKLFSLEYEVFCAVRDACAAEITRVKATAQSLSKLDAILSLAQAAELNHYVKPEISTDQLISIHGGRHPVVERMLEDSSQFIANDTVLNTDDSSCLIITGPNMAGKSTYMRQTALIVLMAQIGSFIPAESAHIGITDRIFTRVGASDDLASGRSTFMVEMSEVAQILHGATKKSLLILDEIGRGTSTSDGLGIAWAVAEYVSNPDKLGARTLFATHYHELTELEGKLTGVKNLRSTVKETENSVVFLHKIVQGGADKSYGIQVAKIAGVPEAITIRAQEIADRIDACDVTMLTEPDIYTSHSTDYKDQKGMDHINLTDENSSKLHADGINLSVKSDKVSDELQLSFMPLIHENLRSQAEEKALLQIKNLNVNDMTPVEALNILCQLQQDIQKQ